MKTRCLTILTTLAFVGFSVHAFAAPPGACSPWPSCKSGDDSSDSHVHMYDVMITGGVLGMGGEWPQKNAKWIVYKHFAQDLFELNLPYFRDSAGPFGSLGKNCFGASGEIPLFQGILQKSKGGSAKGMFWFVGFTHENDVLDRTEVLYVLELTADLDGDWPPGGSSTMTVTSWNMDVENEGKEVKLRSCLKDEETFPEAVMIEVSHMDP
ncbi:MAG: hypothetical protein V3R56_02090 [Xanthomonadales bacterium]